MFWYHVLNNVFKQAKAIGIEPKMPSQFFEDMYNLHFSTRALFEDPKHPVHPVGLHLRSVVQPLVWVVSKQKCITLE
jgi:hypothetical protein